MDDQLIEHYHRHVGTAFDRQLRLAEFRDRKAPGEKWQYDLETATMTLGKVTLEAPALGSRQEHNNSWLWAWSDRNLKLSLVNRAMGATVLSLNHRLGVHQLSAPGFSLEPLLGAELTEHAPDIFGVIFGAELGYDGYHLSNKSLTTVLVRDDRLKVAEKNPLARIHAVFPKLLKALPVLDQRAALIHYARDYGVTIAEQPRVVKLTSGKGELTATFDDRDRLAKLEAVGLPAAKPKPKPKPATVKVKVKVVKKPTKIAAKPATKTATKATAKTPVKKLATKPVAKAKPKVVAKAKKPPAKKR
jgi:hypothetical protein